MRTGDDEAIQRVVQSPLFPFDGDMTIKPLLPLMHTEAVREGEGDKPCRSCDTPERVLWSNDRWKLTPMSPSPNPVGVFLETVEHIDLEHFDDDLAAEMGVLIVRLEAAIRSLDTVGRVHVHRWGDGAMHFHMWFQGRPARQLELYGWGNVLWSQVLEPLAADAVDANHSLVVEHLHAHHGGTVAAFGSQDAPGC